MENQVGWMAVWSINKFTGKELFYSIAVGRYSLKASDFFKWQLLWCKNQAGSHFNIANNTNEEVYILQKKSLPGWI
jgi:hypothetical protein